MNAPRLRLLFLAAVLAAGAAVALPGHLDAQDARTGRAGAARERVIDTPVRHGWLQKTRRVREARAAAEAADAALPAGGPRLSVGARPPGTALTGTLRIPVIAGMYNGLMTVRLPYPGSIGLRLFGAPPVSPYTVRSYFEEVSRGAFSVTGEVTSWVQLPRSTWYYEPDPDSAATDTTFRYRRAAVFVQDALVLADDSVDFTRYDNDGPDNIPNSGDDDGFVDIAAFLYSGSSQCTGPGMVPHMGNLHTWGSSGVYTTRDIGADGRPIRVDDYFVEPGEHECGYYASMMSIERFARRVGAVLGLPELEDTDGATGGVGRSLGPWDLMSQRYHDSYLPEDRRNYPVHLSAWSREFLGWAQVERITASATGVMLPPVDSTGRVLRYDIPGTREYFLMEYRRIGPSSDRLIPAAGLMVYHVDQDQVDRGLLDNTVNSRGARAGVAVEPADGVWDGAHRGDPFPGADSVRLFANAATEPSSRSYAGWDSRFALRNIRVAGGHAVFDVDVSQANEVVWSVTLDSASHTLPQTAIRQLVATPRNANSNPVADRTVTWRSADTTVVAVSPTGVVSGIRAGGPVAVTATVDGRSASTQVTVVPGGLPADRELRTDMPRAVGNTDSYWVQVPAGAWRLHVRLAAAQSGQPGDPTLYIANGARPTEQFYVCRSRHAGSAEESCAVENPAPGTWYVWIDDNAGATTVRADVWGPGRGFVPRDTVVGQIAKAAERDTAIFRLAKGDVLDFAGAWAGGDPRFAPLVEVLDSAGVRLAGSTVSRAGNRTRIVPAFTVPDSGLYRVVVRDFREDFNQGLYTGAYVLRSRRGGPVLATAGTVQMVHRARGAGPVRDTIWVYNGGSVETGYLLSSGGSPWLATSPASGNVAARTAPVGGTVPAGAVRVDLTINTASLEEGVYEDSLTVQGPGDVWNVVPRVPVKVRIHSAQARNAGPAALAMAMAPDGKLVVAESGGLVKVDLATGTRTMWVANMQSNIVEMEFGRDGALYAADHGGRRVLRVAPDGTWAVLFTANDVPYINQNVPVNEIAVMPDGTVFASVGSALVRKLPGERPLAVVQSARSVFTNGMAYNPADGHVYYSFGGTLRRYSMSTGGEAARNALPATAGESLRSLVVGSNGLLYGTEDNELGSVLVLDATGNVVQRLWPPAMGRGLALGNGVLYGSGLNPTAMMWAMDVNDRPFVPGQLVAGDPNGDGEITAQDALGVLSHAVGRPMPPGWNVATAGDANCDGQVTSVDALIILSRVVGRDVAQFCIGSAR